MADYLPYVNAYGAIAKLFAGIKSAAVPPKVSQNFLESVLDLTSSSHRALIPLLKKLGFIDGGNVPTQAYKDFRTDEAQSPIMAERLREAYKPLFAANEYAWKLSKADLQTKLRNVSGAAEDDKIIPTVTSTFLELSKLAKWEGGAAPKKEPSGAGTGAGTGGGGGTRQEELPNGLRLSYTINLNLPATTEIEVFNAIFKSLRENLLRQ